MQAHILSLHTPSTPGVGSEVETFFFSESSHVAYQIRRELSIEYHTSTFCPYTLPRPLGWGQRSKYFL